MGGQGLMPIAVSACDKVVDVCRNLSFRVALQGPLPLIEGIFESFGKGNSHECTCTIDYKQVTCGDKI